MHVVSRMVSTAAAVLATAAAAAQAWPAKPIRLIVPFAAGGSTDNLARLLADRMPAVLGQPLVIDNRGGANGAIGTALAAGANPDGYNYLAVFDSHATNPSLQQSLPFDTLRDFAPVMLIATSPMALVVHAQAPYRTLGDLIAAAKARPGELVLGSGGIGSRGHLALGLLELRAGFKINQVAYRGTGQITTALLAREITMQMGTVFFVVPYVNGQRLRALGVSTAQRLPQLPDTLTIAEQGYPGFEVESWWGVLAPAGTPPAILARMNSELRAILKSPLVQQRLEQLGMNVSAGSADEFGRFIRSEMQFWGKVVRDTGIGAPSP